MAAERRAKGILKTSSSFDKGEHDVPRKEMKWDEMNILATYHPENKDYGHQKIDEPPTPYSKICEEEKSDTENDGLDPEDLASRLAETSEVPKVLQEEEEESSEEEIEETPEQKAKRKEFEEHRKKHYNEFQAIQLARQLMSQDEEEDEEEEEEEEKAGK